MGSPLAAAFKASPGARGVAVDRRRTAGLGDQCAEVFDLPLDGVGRRVAALASPTAVVVDHTELVRQLLGQLLRRLPIAEHAAHDDDGWALTKAVEGDLVPSIEVT